MTITSILHFVVIFVLSYIHTCVCMEVYMCKQQCLSNATCANYFMCTGGKYVNIYALYEHTATSSVASSTGTYTLHIIFLCPQTNMVPYCTCMCHCTVTVLYIYTPHYCTHQPKITNCNVYLPYYCHVNVTTGILPCP